MQSVARRISTLAWSALLCSLSLGACAESNTRPADPDGGTLSDGGRVVDGAVAMPRTRTDLVVGYRFSPGWENFGANLDGLDSPGGGEGCVERTRDVMSRGETGIDNALSTVDATLRMALPEPTSLSDGTQAALLGGELLTIIEVTGVDSYREDDEVFVQLFRGRVPGGGRPASDDGRSITRGISLDAEPLGPPVAAPLERGSVHVRYPAMDFTLRSGDTVIDMPMRDVHLWLEVGDPELVAVGVVGGQIVLSEITGRTAADAEIAERVRTSLPYVADLDPDPTDPTQCSAVSVGFAFSAYDVVRRP